MENDPNPYESSGQSWLPPIAKKPSWKRVFLYLGLGFSFQIALYAAAIVSLGFGHGSDNMADLLFPISNMMFGGNFSERPYPVAFVDDLQYVIYAVAIFVSEQFGKVAAGFLTVVIVHLLAYAISY